MSIGIKASHQHYLYEKNGKSIGIYTGQNEKRKHVKMACDLLEDMDLPDRQ